MTSSSAFLDTLWCTRCPVPTGLGIAIQKGWLEQALKARGTRLQSLRESDDVAVRESHFDHTLRYSVRHGGSIPAIWARASGRETRVVGLSWADEIQLILTTPDTCIRQVRDLKGRRFGLPQWRKASIDFPRVQAVRGLENALRLEGLRVQDVQLVDFPIDAGFSDAPVRHVPGTLVVDIGRTGGRNAEIAGLLRGEVDAIFLKGAHAAQLAHAFGLVTVMDTGSHPDPLVRANNGTPRTLTVDAALLDEHPDHVQLVVEQVLRAEAWAALNPDETRRFLAAETNSAESWVLHAYGADAHQRLRTNLDPGSIRALQDFTDFLSRWEFIPRRIEVLDWIDPGPLAHGAPALAPAALAALPSPPAVGAPWHPLWRI